MLRRFLLALTFVSAFSFVGVGVTDTAEAWRRWGRPYVRYYSRPRSYYYGSYAPYRSYYGPRYYRPYYRDYYYGYGGPNSYYYGPRSGVSFSFGY